MHSIHGISKFQNERRKLIICPHQKLPGPPPRPQFQDRSGFRGSCGNPKCGGGGALPLNSRAKEKRRMNSRMLSNFLLEAFIHEEIYERDASNVCDRPIWQHLKAHTSFILQPRFNLNDPIARAALPQSRWAPVFYYWDLRRCRWTGAAGTRVWAQFLML